MANITMSKNRTNHKSHKSFTLSKLTEDEIDILDSQAEKEFRSLTDFITVELKKIARKIQIENEKNK
ncbi:hypothetical protein ACE193_25345 (plasmid) [Bernardetia sp. OM2101]|uniref:hypothetical protein n=1 Tax=Bernardetia sp. OM2101 TaxID=3344876 RepID=UPI0035CF247E